MVQPRKTVPGPRTHDRHTPPSRLSPCTTPARPVMTERAMCTMILHSAPLASPQSSPAPSPSASHIRCGAHSGQGRYSSHRRSRSRTCVSDVARVLLAAAAARVPRGRDGLHGRHGECSHVREKQLLGTWQGPRRDTPHRPTAQSSPSPAGGLLARCRRPCAASLVTHRH